MSESDQKTKPGAAAPVQPAAAPPAGAPTLRRLNANRCRLAEHVRNVWHIVPEDGTPFAAVLDPAFWSHVAVRLRIGDRIEVYAEDGSYFAELIVRAAGHLSAQLATLRKVDLEPVDTSSVADAFAVQFRGAVRRHSVVRLKDNAVIRDGFESKEAALAWLGQNARSLAA